ncbi:hypothetical protein PSMK_03520 [Phycisphaera mikurensis NBRC 102666]|uniref:Uncharacterized protein n=1 Tax=Phycisphaera mikurensis (strain NBRC 102666 / KCTC 22515 / FYK2301M01) TaxID=1142394 RepID=I0IB73_PHYMF|nr:hypothetical protein PSMK_03520 [Phycisphaera mikurensis NBRC 102666]
MRRGYPAVQPVRAAPRPRGWQSRHVLGVAGSPRRAVPDAT